ncbi:MAG: hypothetical protein Q4C24_01705 [Candidatus Saccharibacteria bacterium]|nr:hypothetical protein [Candidatus Saccharibacteria bacterium]
MLGINKGTIVCSAILSTSLALTCLSYNHASAYTYVGFGTEEATLEGFNAHGDGMGGLDFAVECSELNSFIAKDAPSLYWTNIYLTEDCNANITIPAGKKINLLTDYYTGPGTNSNGETVTRYYGSLDSTNTSFPAIDFYKNNRYRTKVNYTLTNAGSGSTITVENGATLIISGEVSGTTDAAINNSGVTMSMATVNGNIIVNDGGSLYLNGGDYTNANFSNIVGDLKIVDAKVASVGIANMYMVNGCRMEQSNGQYVITQPGYPYQYFKNVNLPVAVDIDMPQTVTGIGYPEIVEASMVNGVSWDTSVLKVSGAPTTGITLTGVKGGVIGFHVQNQYYTTLGGLNISDPIERYQEIMVYRLPEGTSTEKRIQFNKVLNNLFPASEIGFIPDGPLRTFIENSGGTLDLEFTEETIDESDVPEEDLDLIQDSAKEDNSTIEEYYEISAAIVEADTSNELYDITDLGDDVTQTFKLPAPEIEGVDEDDAVYQVYRVHDGEVELLPSIVEDGEIVFDTNKFSTYAIGYTNKVGVPNTGASSIKEVVKSIIGSIVASGILSAAMIVAMRKNSFAKHRKRIDFDKR